MRTATRSALSALTATLAGLGFKACVPTGRYKRPGYSARFIKRCGGQPGLFLFSGYPAGSPDFALVCAALAGAGYRLEDAKGGINFVEYGCARVIPPAV